VLAFVTARDTHARAARSSEPSGEVAGERL
jgi:hypothetical protein